MERHFFVDGKHLGSKEFKRDWGAGEAIGHWLTLGFVYVSPHSGKVWATLPVMNGETANQFCPLTSPALGEPGWCGFPPGSLLNAAIDLLPNLSEAALKRELKIHMDFYSKEQ